MHPLIRQLERTSTGGRTYRMILDTLSPLFPSRTTAQSGFPFCEKLEIHTILHLLILLLILQHTGIVYMMSRVGRDGV